MDSLTPTSHAEAVALFRYGLIGALTEAQMDKGQLLAALKALSKKHFRPPKSVTTKRISVATLERWYYAYRREGLEGLKPESRSDRGRGQERHPSKRSCCATSVENTPHAAVPLILRTLVADGRLDADAVSATHSAATAR